MANKWIQLMSADGTDNLFPVGKMDLLWTNASPSSDFGAQTVSLDLSGYDRFLIKVASDKYLLTYSFYYRLVQKNVGTTLSAIQNNGNTIYNYSRDVLLDNNGAVFSNGRSNASTNSAIAIPIEIYGIK